MAVGDLRYVVDFNSGFGAKDGGFDSDPQSNTLPTILSNGGAERVYEFFVDLYCNTSFIDTESGANTVYSEDPVYDISNISISPVMTPGASRIANNQFRVFNLGFNNQFIDELYTWQTITTVPSSNGTTIETTTYDTVQGANTVYSNTTVTNTLGQSLTVNTSFMDTQQINIQTTSEFVPDEYFTTVSNNSLGILAARTYTPTADEIFVTHELPDPASFNFVVTADVTKQFGDTPITYNFDFDVNWDPEEAFGLIQTYTS
jgi:hypothetical protein